MANSVFTGLSHSYIFDEAGGMRDQLEQTILNELQDKKYPLKATISTVKAGKGLAGALFGTKEQCVVVQVDNEAQIAIANAICDVMEGEERLCKADITELLKLLNNVCYYIMYCFLP